MNKSRALLVTFFLMAIFGFLVYNLFKIQVTDYEMYAKKAFRQQHKEIPVGAERGSIKDRNGKVLSYTKDQVSYYVDTRMVNDKEIESIATKFSNVFNKNKESYIKLIKNGSKNVCIEKKVPKEKTVLLKDFVEDGLFKEEDYSRIYPNGSLAAHVIGFVDKSCEGVDGVEKYYNKELQGKEGVLSIERDVLGRTVAVDQEDSQNAVPGNNVYLTINRTYQKILEEELDAGLKRYACDSAVGIIMDPNTAEILAMSSKPSFDPGNSGIFEPEARRNRAIKDVYEPGSTMKSISMSMLIDKNLVKETDKVNTENGVYKISNVKITGDPRYSSLTVREVIEHSNNIGMAKLIQLIDDKDYYKYLRDFGFGNSTSIDLAGEVKGYLKKPDDYKRISKMFMSFGYEISVTPLQMITAYSALINGGTLYQPYLVKKITDANENVIKEFQPKKIRSVIKPETSEIIKSFMVGVVEQGTGQAARLENVLVGGKTGTSQQYSEQGYSKEKYNTSFIGFLPADNPQVLCLILIDAPEKGKSGGTVAAPIFKKIAQRLVEADINIVPDQQKIKRDEAIFEGLFSGIINGEKSTSFSNPTNENERNAVSKRQLDAFMNRSTMPNLIGMSIREANAVLTNLGLKISKTGNGNVVSQSISPGTKIVVNSVCKIVCRPGNLSRSN